jgi:hypothetical protein
LVWLHWTLTLVVPAPLALRVDEGFLFGLANGPGGEIAAGKEVAP